MKTMLGLSTGFCSAANVSGAASRLAPRVRREPNRSRVMAAFPQGSTGGENRSAHMLLRGAAKGDKVLRLLAPSFAVGGNAATDAIAAVAAGVQRLTAIRRRGIPLRVGGGEQMNVYD